MIIRTELCITKIYNSMDTHITGLDQLLTYNMHKHMTGLNQL